MKYEMTEEFAERMFKFFDDMHNDNDRMGVFLQMFNAWKKYKRYKVKKPLKHAFIETESLTEYVSVHLN